MEKLNKKIGKILGKYPQWTVDYVSEGTYNLVNFQETNFVVIATQPDDDMPPVLTVALIFNLADGQEQPIELLNKFNSDFDEVKVSLLSDENGTSLSFTTSICLDFLSEDQLNEFVHWSTIQLFGYANKGIEAGFLPSLAE